MNFTFPQGYNTHRVGGNRKRSLQSENVDQKISRNSVFNCHLSPFRRQIAIESHVSNDFLSTFVDCINIFDCCLPGVLYLITCHYGL